MIAVIIVRMHLSNAQLKSYRKRVDATDRSVSYEIFFIKFCIARIGEVFSKKNGG